MKNKCKTLYQLADKAGMSTKTARKYLKSGVLPSQCQAIHDWPTHPDAFAGDWPWVEEFLKNNSGIESKSLFEALQREYPGKYHDSGENINEEYSTWADKKKNKKIIVIRRPTKK